MICSETGKKTFYLGKH